MKIPNLDYKPTFANVRGIHIAVVVVLLLLAYHFFFGGASLAFARFNGKNGDGSSTYVDTQSFSGWIATQYNSLGANAGALNGESN